MSESLAGRAGHAISWQAVQHFGVKVIYLVRVVVLARLLVPDDFGLVAIAMVSVGVLMSLTDFGMVPALVQQSEVDDRHYDAAWTVGMVRALTVSAGVILAAPWIAQLFAEPRAVSVIRALGIWPVLQAGASIKVADLTRRLRFREVALLRLAEALVTTGVSVALAFRFGVWALVAGSLAGPLVYTLLSYVFAQHRPRLVLERSAVAPLVQFGRWIFVSSLVAVGGRAVLQLVITRKLGAADLGLYFLAARLAFLPSGAASDIVGGVAFPFYARIRSDSGKARAAFQAQILGLSVLLFPVYGLLMALAPSLAVEVLGANWIGTAPVIRVLAVASLVGVLGDVVDPILKGFGQPAKMTFLEVVQSVTLVVAVWGLADWYGLAGAAAAWIPAVFASQVFAVLFLLRVFDRPFEGLLRPVLVIAVLAALGTWTAVVVDGLLDGLPGLIAAGLVGTGVIGLLLLIAERYLNLGLLGALDKIFPRAAVRLRPFAERGGGEH